MNNYSRVAVLAASALLAMTAGLSAIADDTEIFLATPTGTPPRPNVLIIIDTSGSMDTNVDIRPAYNPAGTYTGTCDENRVYWKAPSSKGTTSPPGCGTTQWVSASNMLCKSIAEDLATQGSTSIKFVGQWQDRSGTDSDKWTTPAGSRNSYIECKADADIGHGRADGDNLIPANKSRGPYNSDASRAIDWNDDAVNDSYLFYTGKYLNWYHNTPVSETKKRLAIVQDAAKELIDSNSLNGTNVGLMRFNSKYFSTHTGTIRAGADDNYRGGVVAHQFAAIESSRKSLKDAIDGFEASSYTPLSETLYEAYRYFSGGAVLFGGDGQPTSNVAAAVSGSNYISPITASCQQNFIIFLTDGGPTDDMEVESLIESPSMLGAQCADNMAHVGVSSSEQGDGVCLDELAGYMFNRDFFGTAASGQPKENIRTFMIGFGDSLPVNSQALLEDTARAGGGESFSATDPVSLREAFENIASNIVADEVSFTAPTVSVNAFNRTRNLNDLFFTVFEPAQAYHWPGNLKKYRIGPDGTIRGFGSTDSAVDESTGFFDTAAQSYWSDVVDGRNVKVGGAAHELPTPASRKLYTDAAALVDSGLTNLTLNENKIVNANTTYITADLLGMPGATAAERTNMIEWVRGADIDDDDKDLNTTERRFVMGDPLHARPVSVIYGGTAAAPEAVVYTATNDGYLHAFDPNGADNSAEELWAYLPSELMPRLHELRTTKNSAVKRYALDANLVAHKIDVDNDGIVEPADGDKVLLFFGMGRGGSNYYALDVTNKTTPKLLWRRGAADTNLSALGQTWSTPVVTKVSVQPTSGPAVERLVVIFGGGYDPAQDGGTDASLQANYRTDTVGNGIYMLDALTGGLVWRTGPTAVNGFPGYAKMTNAIPADVRVIDLTGDGLADRMYAGDMGGRIWRFDIINGQPDTSLVRGGVFASLGRGDGGGSNPLDARRFYTAPDVSIVKENNVTFLNIAIGSGFRGHPLNTRVNDRFYSLRDPIPFRAMTAAEYTAMNLDPIIDDESVSPPDLVNITAIGTPTIPTTAKGWKINFTNGEKVLSDSQTFAGSVLFSTFKPAGNTSASACSARSGTNTFYAARVSDGRALTDRDGDGTFEAEDRGRELEQSGIAPPAVILFPTPEADCVGAACSPPPVCLVGPESCGVSFTNDPVKTFWMQQNAD